MNIKAPLMVNGRQYRWRQKALGKRKLVEKYLIYQGKEE